MWVQVPSGTSFVEILKRCCPDHGILQGCLRPSSSVPLAAGGGVVVSRSLCKQKAPGSNPGRSSLLARVIDSPRLARRDRPPAAPPPGPVPSLPSFCVLNTKCPHTNKTPTEHQTLLVSSRAIAAPALRPGKDTRTRTHAHTHMHTHADAHARRGTVCSPVLLLDLRSKGERKMRGESCLY